MKKYRRKHNSNLPKATKMYSVSEICDLLGVCKETAQRWFRKGLTPIDNKKPYLVKGFELRRFLKVKEKKIGKSKANEICCLKCRRNVVPRGSVVSIHRINDKRMNIKGVCPHCGSVVQKLQSISQFENIKKNFVIHQQAEKHI